MHKLPDDPRFKFVSYRATDLERTFDRIRRQMKAEKSAREAAERAERERTETAMRNVAPIKGRSQ